MRSTAPATPAPLISRRPPPPSATHPEAAESPGLPPSRDPYPLSDTPKPVAPKAPASPLELAAWSRRVSTGPAGSGADPRVSAICHPAIETAPDPHSAHTASP